MECRPRGNFTLLFSSSHHYYYDSDDQEESMWGVTTASRNLTRLSCRDMEEMWSVVIIIERSLSLLLSLQIQLLLSLSLFRPKVRPDAQLRRAGALPLNLLNSLTHSLLCHKVGGKLLKNCKASLILWITTFQTKTHFFCLKNMCMCDMNISPK